MLGDTAPFDPQQTSLGQVCAGSTTRDGVLRGYAIANDALRSS